jgi:hypothetical protein
MALANELAGCEQTPADSQIYLDGDVRRVLFGIDIDVGELLLAREIGADGVIAHHPMGSRARLDFPQMVERHEIQMVAEGIDRETARRIMLARKLPVQRGVHALNYSRVTDAVRLLHMPAMNIHLAADLIGRRHFEEAVRAAVADGCETAGELIQALRRIPEFQHSLVQPELWLGRPENPIGRWVVQMAAGTNGGFPVFSTYFQHGVATILAMHVDREDLRKLEELNHPTANLIITGHMPSDSIGINEVIRAITARGVDVIPGSGLITV